jgi:hypothetical protein
LPASAGLIKIKFLCLWKSRVANLIDDDFKLDTQSLEKIVNMYNVLEFVPPIIPDQPDSSVKIVLFRRAQNQIVKSINIQIGKKKYSLNANDYITVKLPFFVQEKLCVDDASTVCQVVEGVPGETFYELGLDKSQEYTIESRTFQEAEFYIRGINNTKGK